MRKARVNARRATLAVLEILQERTDQNNPISIANIVSEMKDGYELITDRDVVKRILVDIQEFYPVFSCDYGRGAEKESGEGYTYGYWLEQPFTLREGELLLDQATQENIVFLRRVIARNLNRSDKRAVSLKFGGIGSDGKVHPKKEDKPMSVIPLKICVVNNHPYLIGLFLQDTRRGEAKKQEKPLGLAHLRIDLMRDLTEVRGKVLLNEHDRLASARLEQAWAADTYLSSHPYMAYEGEMTPQKVVLRIRKWVDRPDASLTFLNDVFAGHWTVLQEDDKTVEVRVECMVAYGLERFIWENLERVEVIGPESVKASVEGALRKRCEAFLRRPAPNSET